MLSGAGFAKCTLSHSPPVSKQRGTESEMSHVILSLDEQKKAARQRLICRKHGRAIWRPL